MLYSFLNFEITGPQGQTPIMLVPPGALRGWTTWKPHAEALSKKHMVIRVQRLNVVYAENQQLLPKEYSLQWESQALKNTIDKLGVTKVHLVGWSHGGQVSLDFALNNPDNVASLTLIEPSAYWLAHAYGIAVKEEQNFKKVYDRLHTPPTEDDLIRFLKLVDLVPLGTNPRSMPQWPVWNQLKGTLLGLHTDLEHTDNIARLQALRDKPVMIVKGKESTLTIGADLLAKELDNAKVIVLPDGYACHIVAQNQFLSELEQFITQSEDKSAFL